jgi:hypothetical protein
MGVNKRKRGVASIKEISEIVRGRFVGIEMICGHKRKNKWQKTITSYL